MMFQVDTVHHTVQNMLDFRLELSVAWDHNSIDLVTKPTRQV
jgi:hypothetical protein